MRKESGRLIVPVDSACGYGRVTTGGAAGDCRGGGGWFNVEGRAARTGRVARARRARVAGGRELGSGRRMWGDGTLRGDSSTKCE